MGSGSLLSIKLTRSSMYTVLLLAAILQLTTRENQAKDDRAETCREPGSLMIPLVTGAANLETYPTSELSFDMIQYMSQYLMFSINYRLKHLN